MHPMGVAPEFLGDTDRTAWGVVSDPSRVRLKDLVLHQLGVSALDGGSFADSFLVGPAGESLGPRWAKEKRTGLCGLRFPGG